MGLDYGHMQDEFLWVLPLARCCLKLVTPPPALGHQHATMCGGRREKMTGFLKEGKVKSVEHVVEGGLAAAGQGKCH